MPAEISVIPDAIESDVNGIGIAHLGHCVAQFQRLLGGDAAPGIFHAEYRLHHCPSELAENFRVKLSPPILSSLAEGIPAVESQGCHDLVLPFGSVRPYPQSAVRGGLVRIVLVGGLLVLFLNLKYLEVVI